MSELLSCPFCGGDAYSRRSIVNDEVMYAVFCDVCDASVSWFMAKERAIAAWNRRADYDGDYTAVETTKQGEGNDAKGG